ncbi:MAG: hypothetical protein PHP85_14625 [Gallionella sp.]|nr:hypothetical protein [Gallionella sp.]
MTENELKAISGLIAGMQLAIVHLANITADNNGLSREDVASSFETTAELVPKEANNQAVMQLVLRQIASGMRSPVVGAEYDALISRLLH